MGQGERSGRLVFTYTIVLEVRLNVRFDKSLNSLVFSSC
jgi:hypothetical protein